MITTNICNSYRSEVLDGVHQAGDVYMIALYTNAASLDKSTTAYSATNEASGTGYTAGGMVLTGRSSGVSGDTAYLDWDDPVWPASTITARGCLIYNASRGNKAVAVYDFGQDVLSSNGNFTVTMPAPGLTAIVRAA